MEQQSQRPDPRTDQNLADELRELGSALSALGRTAFRGGRVLSVKTRNQPF